MKFSAKYAAAFAAFAFAVPAFGQTTTQVQTVTQVQSDPEEFGKMVCAIRGICDPAEIEKAWAIATARRDDGPVGEYKGPIPTVGVSGPVKVAGSTRVIEERRPNSPRPRPRPRPRPVIDVVAEVTPEIQGNYPLMVTFGSNSDQLTPGALTYVSTFADILRVDEAMGKTDSKFVIEGHTDTVGSTADNQELSRKRAETVVETLVEMGFDADRFIVVGKGEAEPVEGRRGRDPLNRRVIAKAID